MVACQQHRVFCSTSLFSSSKWLEVGGIDIMKCNDMDICKHTGILAKLLALPVNCSFKETARSPTL